MARYKYRVARLRSIRIKHCTELDGGHSADASSWERQRMPAACGITIPNRGLVPSSAHLNRGHL